MQSKPTRSPHRRRPQRSRAHGWARATDRAATPTASAADGNPTYRPGGMALLSLVLVGIGVAVGGARVHVRNRVLELGAEISELTSEQARLMDIKRRLEAERAYLRHPDRVRDYAKDRLRLEPIAPARLHRVSLVATNPDKKDRRP